MPKLVSDITIGQYRFSGVHEIVIKKSIHNFVETAAITLPAIGSFFSKGNSGKTGSKRKMLADVFKAGDPVKISIGYDTDIKTEFEGFVTNPDINFPCKVECEGYSFMLRRNTVSGYKSSISVADLANLAVQGLDIKVVCTIDSMLTNVPPLRKSSAFDILNYIKKATGEAVSIFFIAPKVLWIGLLYTPYANGANELQKAFRDAYGDTKMVNEVKYRLGFNCPLDNGLKRRVLNNKPVEIILSNHSDKGEQLHGISKKLKETLYNQVRKILPNIKSKSDLQKFADELALKTNYQGYEGTLTGFLQPYSLPGFKAYIINKNFPDLAGWYLLDDVEVHFGVRGARRVNKIGVQIGFSN